jgi:hypothetical protein
MGFVLLILFLCSLSVFSGVCVIDSVFVFTASFQWCLCYWFCTCVHFQFSVGFVLLILYVFTFSNTGTESITQTPLKTGSEHRNRIKITDETVIKWDFLNFVLSSNPLTLSYNGEPFISFSDSLQLLHETAMMFNFSIFLCGNLYKKNLTLGIRIDHKV